MNLIPDWITSHEAAEIAGVTYHSITNYAHKHGWPRKETRGEDGKGRGRFLYPRDYVEAYAAKRQAKTDNGAAERHKEVLSLVEWADGLTQWPTAAEIMEWVTFTFRVPDIELVIELRHYRNKDLPKLREPQRIKPGGTLRLVYGRYDRGHRIGVRSK